MEACRETYSRFQGESRRNNNRVSTYTTITLNNTAILRSKCHLYLMSKLILKQYLREVNKRHNTYGNVKT